MRYLLSIVIVLVVNFSFAQENLTLEAENPEIGKSLKSLKRKGDLHKESGRFIKAINWYEKAELIAPEDSYLKYVLATCYFNSDQDSLALFSFQKAYSLNSEVEIDINYYLARTNHLRSNFLEAIRFYTIEKKRIDKDVESHSNRSELTKYIAECKAGKELITAKDTLVEVQNLGNLINTEKAEYGTYIANDLFYFTAKRKENIVTDKTEDIYFSTKKDSLWGEVKNIGKPINTFDNDVVVNVSSDGNVIYLYATTHEGDLYYSEFQTPNWSLPKSFSDKINSEFAETSMCFSETGDTVFFVSTRTESLGGKDIFYSVKQDGEWKEPENIGDLINTKYDEESVFVKGNTLYFSSRGHNSVGGYDIFKTKKTSHGTWSKPINLGFPINSTYDDLFFSYANGKTYFSSNREGGMGEMDIYTLAPAIAVKGVVDEVDTVAVASVDTKKELKIVYIQNIQFEMNSYENDEAYIVLDKLSSFLLDEPAVKILILGYSDTQGGNDYNLSLSRKRAEFVKKYLISKGISENLLLLEAKGESKQISRNIDEKGRYIRESLKYNRRVEFQILQQGVNKLLKINAIEIPDKFKL